MFLHAGEGHVELIGKLGDRRVGPSELLQDAAPGGVRKRGEGGIEMRWHILNHMVQYRTRIGCMQERPGTPPLPRRAWAPKNLLPHNVTRPNLHPVA